MASSCYFGLLVASGYGFSHFAHSLHSEILFSGSSYYELSGITLVWFATLLAASFYRASFKSRYLRKAIIAGISIIVNVQFVFMGIGFIYYSAWEIHEYNSYVLSASDPNDHTKPVIINNGSDDVQDALDDTALGHRITISRAELAFVVLSCVFSLMLIVLDVFRVVINGTKLGHCTSNGAYA
ncbi:Uu.00g083490.m01.CDS01 [Anthostomella pinea]|uniref:Uu.00g083490.m01.CDS01 n=1 Tax=Anthostomella pinea TaxID=933095 RepID=A0AAI8VG66_9PEZI|nr:Uu.00g083490.m01.CDS01 [Anthostomella pinea]